MVLISTNSFPWNNQCVCQRRQQGSRYFRRMMSWDPFAFYYLLKWSPDPNVKEKLHNVWVHSLYKRSTWYKRVLNEMCSFFNTLPLLLPYSLRLTTSTIGYISLSSYFCDGFVFPRGCFLFGAMINTAMNIFVNMQVVSQNRFLKVRMMDPKNVYFTFW